MRGSEPLDDAGHEGEAYRTDCWRCGYRRAGLPEGAPCPECGMTRTEARVYLRERSQRRLYRVCLRLVLTACPLAVLLAAGWLLARVVLGLPHGAAVADGVYPVLDVIGIGVKLSVLLAVVSPIGLLVLPFEVVLLIRLGRRFARPWRARVVALLLAAVPAVCFVSLLIPGNPLRAAFDWLPA